MLTYNIIYMTAAYTTKLTNLTLHYCSIVIKVVYFTIRQNYNRLN